TAMQAYLSGHAGQHGGATGSVGSGTLVASGINGPPAPAQNPPSTGGVPPGTGITEGVRLATWDEIDNSQLAGVTAKYSGTAVGTVTNDEGQSDATGDFALKYSFARHSGELKITDFGGYDLWSRVHMDATTGFASFDGRVHGYGESCECGVRGSTSGSFIDQGTSIGSGVAGIFDASGGEGGPSITGAYSGNLTGTYTPHPAE
ncbi:MAG: hypothetical protein ABI377_06410, partial [Devosia sp.]